MEYASTATPVHAMLTTYIVPRPGFRAGSWIIDPFIGVPGVSILSVGVREESA